jgi:hypothetical protein
VFQNHVKVLVESSQFTHMKSSRTLNSLQDDQDTHVLFEASQEDLKWPSVRTEFHLHLSQIADRAFIASLASSSVPIN